MHEDTTSHAKIKFSINETNGVGTYYEKSLA